MSYTQSPEHTSVPDPGPLPPAASPTRSNGLATAGFVLGLLALLGSWIPLLNVVAILLAVVGLVLAGVGLAKSKKANAGKGLSIAGLVLGVLAILFAILINAVFVSAVDEAIDEATDTSVQVSGEGNGASEGASHEDSAIGTTRDHPAPLGSSITGDDWTVKVNSVKTIDQDSIGQKAQAGSTLLLINLTATYNGDDEQGESPWVNVKFVTADGKTTIDSVDGSTLFLADKTFDSLKTVYDGGKVTGDQIIEVPADNWQGGVLAVSPDLLSDDTFVAVK